MKIQPSQIKKNKENKENINYYDVISSVYEELYGQEQIEKALFLKTLISFENNDLILDVGSGTGHYLKVFDKGKFICVDTSRKLLEKNPYEKYLAPAENLPFKDKFFDYTISLTAIQNFFDVEKAISEMLRVTKKKIFITTMVVSKVNTKIRNFLKKSNVSIDEKKFNKEVFYIIDL